MGSRRGKMGQNRRGRVWLGQTHAVEKFKRRREKAIGERGVLPKKGKAQTASKRESKTRRI